VSRADPIGLSRLPAILWIGWASFIVYGGTIPFHFEADRATVADKLSRLTINPFISPDTGDRVSIPDVVQNVLLFTPFGFFGVMATRQRRSLAVSVIVVVSLGALLSAGVEALQLLEIDRTTSFSDVCTNIAGTVGGAIGALALSNVTRLALERLRALGVVDVPMFYPFAIATIIVCVAAWEPFDFTLDVGILVGKIRALRADPWQFTVLNDEGVELVRYALFGLAASLWLRQLGVRRAAMIAATTGAALAFVLEASQWIIGSRMPGLEDATVHAAGVVGGAALSQGWPHGRSATFWCLVLWAATAGGASLQMLSPFQLIAVHQPLRWMPFANYYAHTTFETLSHVFELTLIYFPLGFVAALRDRSVSRIFAAVIAATLIALPLEYLQGWIAGRYGDITDVGVALLGALAGVWAASAPEIVRLPRGAQY
jgi:glycopeptide antibiotics resistance protein